jgi:serine protease Do
MKERLKEGLPYALVVLLLLVTLVHTSPSSGATGFESEWPAVRVAAMVTPSVVGVVTYEGTPDGPTLPRGAGSGIVYRSDGVIVTNYHVVAKATAIKVILPDGHTRPARLIGADAMTDLAVLKVDADNLRPVTFAAAPAKVGELAIAIGSPMGPSFARTVTVGVVSGLNRWLGYGYAQRAFDLIQTDAAINPGNSGGPLVDAEGRVLGLNSVKVAAPGYEGMGFAIPAATVQQVANAILRHGHVVRPWLGIGVMGPETARRLGIPLRSGFLVEDVYPGGPGAVAGLRPGDVIITVDGRTLPDLTDLYRLLERKKAGDTLLLTVQRGTERIEVRVVLRDMPYVPPTTESSAWPME